MGLAGQKTKIGAKNHVCGASDYEIDLVPQKDPGNDSIARLPIHGKWQVESDTDDDPVLNEEGPKQGVGEIECQIWGDQSLHGAGEAPAICEFTKEWFFGQDRKSSGYCCDVAKVAGNKVFERGVEFHHGKCELIHRKYRQANEGEGCTWPDETASAFPDADPGNQGDHNNGQSVNNSKKGHGRTLDDFFTD